MNGLCECGCGQPTRIARVTDKRWGVVAGRPVRFINGHQQRMQKTSPAWVEEDRGYETPCWIWVRGMGLHGYGVAKVDGRMHNAHRAVYQREHGPIAPGLVLDHLCRVRACVNPDHMEPITTAQNIQRGAAAKLNEDAVREIWGLIRAGLMNTEIAERFGVSDSRISEIRTGKRWANVLLEAPKP